MRGSESNDPRKNPSSRNLYNLSVQLADESDRHPTADSLHAFGLSQLLLGESEDAVATLQKALRQETGITDITKALRTSTDAALLSDLSDPDPARAAPDD